MCSEHCTGCPLAKRDHYNTRRCHGTGAPELRNLDRFLLQHKLTRKHWNSYFLIAECIKYSPSTIIGNRLADRFPAHGRRWKCLRTVPTMHALGEGIRNEAMHELRNLDRSLLHDKLTSKHRNSCFLIATCVNNLPSTAIVISLYSVCIPFVPSGC